MAGVYRKMHLPNYGVFDEQRYFQAGAGPATIEVNGVVLGLSVCEDIWMPGPPASSAALAGARVIVNLSASPYHARKGMERERMLVQRARDYQSAVLFCNAVGGQDELVFDGHSLALDQEGRVVARAPQFEESLTVCTIDPAAVTGARLRDTRHRADVRARAPRRRAGRGHRSPRWRCRREPRRRSAARSPAAGRGGRGLRRAAHGSARLRRQERLRARGVRPVRWASTRRWWPCWPWTPWAPNG